MGGDHHRATGQPGFDGHGQQRHCRRIERGGGLVEQQHGSGSQQGAGQCDPLTFPGAEGQPVVADRGLQPCAQARHEIGQPDRVEHGAQFVVARLGRAETQVLRERGVEQVRPLGQPGEVVSPVRVRAEHLPTRGDSPGARHHETQECGEDRRLARSRGPRERDARCPTPCASKRREGRAGPDARYSTTSPEISSAADEEPEREGFTGSGCGRSIEHLEHAVCRRLPLCAGVELRAGASQRDEDLGCDEQHGHRRLQIKLSPEKAKPEDHGDEPDTEPGDNTWIPFISSILTSSKIKLVSQSYYIQCLTASGRNKYFNLPFLKEITRKFTDIRFIINNQ